MKKSQTQGEPYKSRIPGIKNLILTKLFVVLTCMYQNSNVKYKGIKLTITYDGLIVYVFFFCFCKF